MAKGGETGKLGGVVDGTRTLPHVPQKRASSALTASHAIHRIGLAPLSGAGVLQPRRRQKRRRTTIQSRPVTLFASRGRSDQTLEGVRGERNCSVEAIVPATRTRSTTAARCLHPPSGLRLSGHDPSIAPGDVQRFCAVCMPGNGWRRVRGTTVAELGGIRFTNGRRRRQCAPRFAPPGTSNAC